MRFLKIVLIVIGILILAGIIMGLAGPKEYHVERSIVVDASPAIVWPYVSNVRNTDEWSPFAAMDTSMTIEYFGNDGEIGSGSKWEGKKAGKGEQSIAALEAPKSVDTKLKFYMPWGESESDAYFHLDPEAAGTKVTWGIKGKNDFVGRIMGTMMNMDKAIGPMFDTGLADLKMLIVEKAAAVPATGNYQINQTDYPGETFMAIRGEVMMSDIASFYEKNLGAIMGALGGRESDMAGPPAGLYYTWDPESGKTNMAAAIPVNDNVQAGKDMEIIKVPASKALVIDYMGGYHGIGGAHMAMDEYMKANNLMGAAPVIESYLTDPGMEPDSNKWMTKIIYPLK